MNEIGPEELFTFKDFEPFCQVINNIDDLKVIIQLFMSAGRSINQKEFKRAIKICSNGNPPSNTITDLFYRIFIKKGT